MDRRNFTVSIGTKLAPDDAQDIAALAAADGVKTGEFVRRELLEVIRRRRLGIARDTEFLLGHILALQETVLTVLESMSEGNTIGIQDTNRVKSHFEELRAGMAEQSLRKEKETHA